MTHTQALEPYISGEIMAIHHEKHHQAYVTNLNAAVQAHAAAVTAGDIASQIALQASLKFNGGGHINHSLFWKNLAPSDAPETQPDAAPSLQAEIEKTWGTLDAFKKAFSATLLALQGSGWGWLVKEGASIRIITTKDQDPVVGGEIPVLGVDMWEHAYYLQVSTMIPPVSVGGSMGLLLFMLVLTCVLPQQYLNGKAAYVENIWHVINWKTAEERFLGTGESIPEAPNGSI